MNNAQKEIQKNFAQFELEDKRDEELSRILDRWLRKIKACTQRTYVRSSQFYNDMEEHVIFNYGVSSDDARKLMKQTWQRKINEGKIKRIQGKAYAFEIV